MNPQEIGETMVEIIDASVAAAEPAFKSAEDAIRYSRSLVASGLDEDVMRSCIGRVAVSVSFCDYALKLHLDNETILDFHCAHNLVKLTIKEASQANTSGEPQLDDVVLLRLAGRETLWRRGELGLALRGNKILAIRPTGLRYFLSMANNDILLISVLINNLNGLPFIFWYPAK